MNKLISMPIYLYNDTIKNACGIQIIITILVTFTFLIVSKIKNIELFDNNVLNQVFHNVIIVISKNKKSIAILVSVTLVACIAIGLIFFKEYSTGYIIICIVNAISILYCAGIINQLYEID
jgi:hypothetical protein